MLDHDRFERFRCLCQDLSLAIMIHLRKIEERAFYPTDRILIGRDADDAREMLAAFDVLAGLHQDFGFACRLFRIIEYRQRLTHARHAIEGDRGECRRAVAKPAARGPGGQDIVGPVRLA
jgi:hypothetical protein